MLPDCSDRKFTVMEQARTLHPFQFILTTGLADLALKCLYNTERNKLFVITWFTGSNCNSHKVCGILIMHQMELMKLRYIH